MRCRHRTPLRECAPLGALGDTANGRGSQEEIYVKESAHATTGVSKSATRRAGAEAQATPADGTRPTCTREGTSLTSSPPTADGSHRHRSWVPGPSPADAEDPKGRGFQSKARASEKRQPWTPDGPEAARRGRHMGSPSGRWGWRRKLWRPGPQPQALPRAPRRSGLAPLPL